MNRVLAGVIIVLGFGRPASAATVNWLDPLNYLKPAPLNIGMPDEASTANKYYVDLSSGGGSSCSQSSPCKSIDNLIGKPGTAGGPAYVYVRGKGGLSLYNDTFYGSPGKEIVIKTWPGFTATFTGNSNTASTNVHDIIFDGGPDLGISFISDQAGDIYSLHILSDNTTIYRTRHYSTSGGSLLLSVGDSRVISGTRIINNEFYGCDTKSGYQCSALYAGPGDGGGYSGLQILNNIIRDMGGDGIEINPRVTSNGLTISGNAIHNVGKQTCAGNWLCRPAVTVGVQSGGGNNATIITNNLMWDIGSGCVWDRGGGNPRPVIANNTCYDYGKGTMSGNPNPEGVSGYSDGGTATVSNNIVFAPNGTAPFDASRFAGSNNLCGSGKACLTSSRTWSSATVLSTTVTASFLQIGSGSEARNGGTAVAAVSTSYVGGTRPQESVYDIGAVEFGSGTTPPPPPAAPAPPTSVRIVR